MGVADTSPFPDSPSLTLALAPRVGVPPAGQRKHATLIGGGRAVVRTRAGSTSPRSPTSSSSAVRAPPNSWLPFAGAQGPGLTQTRVAGATFLTFHFMISDLVTFRRAARPGPAFGPLPPAGGRAAYNARRVKSFLHQNTDSYPPPRPYNPKHPISSGATPSARFPSPPPRAGWRWRVQQGGRRRWGGGGIHSTMICRCCCPSHSTRTEATDRSRKRNQPSLMASGFQASLKGHPSAFIGSLSLRPEDKRTDHKVE